MTINKKSLWNLLKIVIFWVLYVTRILAWLDQNCWFFMNSQILSMYTFLTYTLLPMQCKNWNANHQGTLLVILETKVNVCPCASLLLIGFKYQLSKKIVLQMIVCIVFMASSIKSKYERWDGWMRTKRKFWVFWFKVIKAKNKITILSLLFSNLNPPQPRGVVLFISQMYTKIISILYTTAGSRIQPIVSGYRYVSTYVLGM